MSAHIDDEASSIRSVSTAQSKPYKRQLSSKEKSVLQKDDDKDSIKSGMVDLPHFVVKL